MLNNDQFLSNWKPIHKKGIFSYMFRRVLFPIIILILVIITSLVINPPINTDNIRSIIILVAISISITIITQVRHWIKGEKRYKRIITSQYF